jgi:hypothetical protein
VVTGKLKLWPTVAVATALLVRTGASCTVSVSVCTAAAPTPLPAVRVSVRTPPDIATGVPAMVAVPLRWSVKVSPAGSEPVSVIGSGVGRPVVVTVNDPPEPTVKVAAFGLVIDEV